MDFVKPYSMSHPYSMYNPFLFVLLLLLLLQSFSGSDFPSSHISRFNSPSLLCSAR